MKISELAVKPSLVKVVLDDADIVEQYSEGLEFYVWDRQPLENFIRFAGQEITPEMFPELVKFAQELILDEDGNKILVDDKLLPSMVLSRAVTKVMQQLGK